MRRKFQIILSVSVFLLLLISNIIFTFAARRMMFNLLVDQVIEDNKVIGEQVLDILDVFEYEDISRENFISYLQRLCDQIMLPNEGFICVADPSGKLVALPGLDEGEDVFIDTAQFVQLEEGKTKKFAEIAEDELFKGYYNNPDVQGTDLIVSMPLGDTGLRMIVHQNREAVEDRAAAISSPVFFMHLGFSLLISVFVFLLVNAQVQQYENRLELLNRRLHQTNNELKRVSRQRMQLLHMLSHDLANPIGAIKSVCDLCYTDTERSSVQEYHRLVESSIGRSIGIINLVRKLEALETGKMDLELQPINVQKSIQSSLEVLKNKYPDKNINFSIDISSNLAVQAEEHSLVNTVFGNILSNAIKFSPAGNDIEISAEAHDSTVQIVIADHGIGIPKELLPKLFDIGSHTNRPGTEGEEGTGFGMPLVKSFIEHFGGTISVQSQTAEESVQSGTRCIIELQSAVDIP
jgi:signal transduction histidine kinase